MWSNNTGDEKIEGGSNRSFFKILNRHENIDPNIFVKIKTGKTTRGHDFTLMKEQNRLDFRKYSFSQRTVNEWNKLSAVCVHSTVLKLNSSKYPAIHTNYS